MSDYDWQWVEENPQTALEIINNLERENAALRQQIAALGEIACLNLDDSTVAKCDAITDGEKYRDVMHRILVDQPKEIAALRKDKERLDLLNTLRQYYSHPPLRKVSGWAWSIVDERDERTGDIRDTIDAIKNKTENDKITYHKGPDFMASGVAVVHTF